MDFITDAADYDAIRALLGVEVVDVEDVIIELPTYGPAIEARMKEAVPDWETLMADSASPAAIFLVNAACYGVAAVMCESYVKGGTVSLVHEEMPRRNWSEWARIFWLRYNEFLSRAHYQSDPNLDDDGFELILLSGPTRSEGAHPRWDEIYPARLEEHAPDPVTVEAWQVWLILFALGCLLVFAVGVVMLVVWLTR